MDSIVEYIFWLQIMPNSLDDDELEDGELDDEGECDDVMPESMTSLKAVQGKG